MGTTTIGHQHLGHRVQPYEHVSRFAEVERRVLEQHQDIRARLRGLAAAVERSSTQWTDHPKVALLRLADVFDAHLTFEEQSLAPCIRELDAWGAVREAAMQREHVEQRQRLERVCAMADGSVAVRGARLRREISMLVLSLLEDMEKEEAALADLLRIDEDGSLDQMTG